MVTSSDYLYDLRLRATGEGRPLTCVWEVTTGCRLRCRHCYHPAHEPQPEELGTDSALRLLDELAEVGVLLLLVTGGEPFGRPDIWELLEAAAQREFAVRILSSGTGLERGDIERLAGIGPLSVDLSLYGEGKTHDDIVGVSGAFRETCRTGRLLTQHGVRVTVKMPLLRSNVSEYGRVREIADSWGAEVVTDAAIFCRLDGDSAPLDLQASQEQLLDFMLRMRQLTGAAYRPAGNVTAPTPDRPLCSAGRSSFFVSSTGKVCPCAVWREELGDVSVGPLAQALGSPRAREIRGLTVGDLKECGSCRLARWCVRCPGLARLESGDALGRSITGCRLAELGSEFQQLVDNGAEVPT